MLNILLIIFAGIGITNLAVNSSLFDIHRKILINFVKRIGLNSEKFSELLGCMMCCGFWIGLVIGLLVGQNCILMAGAVSGLSYLYGKTIEYLEVATALQSIKIMKEEVEEIELNE